MKIRIFVYEFFLNEKNQLIIKLKSHSEKLFLVVVGTTTHTTHYHYHFLFQLPVSIEDIAHPSLYAN